MSAMSSTTAEVPAARPAAATILPIVGVIFAGYLVIGVAMPVLPLHVHQGLGFGTFVVGLVAGSQFGASLISRFTAGHLADVRGAKQAVTFGLLAAGAAGLLYLLSLAFPDNPTISLSILLLGRAVLGGAESMMVAGALNWGLALAGAKNTGRTMSWVGTAMYVAYAVGAPVGSLLYAQYGFASVAWTTAAVPLLTLLLVAALARLGPRMDRAHCRQHLVHRRPVAVRASARPDRWPADCYGCRPGRSGRTSSHLAGRHARLGVRRRGAGGPGLRVSLSGIRRRSRSPRSTGQPRAGCRSLHRVPRSCSRRGEPPSGVRAAGAGLSAVFLASAIIVACAAVIAVWLNRAKDLEEVQ